MEHITKPMLADKFDDFESGCVNLVFPLLATPKLDGIRCVKTKGKALSRTFKPIPNIYVRTCIEQQMPDNTDMELVSGDFNDTTSAIMSGDGEPAFKAWVIDYVKDNLSKPYIDRMKDLETLFLPAFCSKVLPVVVYSLNELKAIVALHLDQGHEGTMIRTPHSPYKCGRGTLTQCDLVKIKPFVDAEATIIAYEEMCENTNAAEKDAFGRTKRSQAQAGMIPKGLLGKWIVKGINGQFKGVEFGLGTAKGVTLEMRKEWWEHRDTYIGKIVTYKYQKYGSVDAPRIPVFKGFRDKRDI